MNEADAAAVAAAGTAGLRPGRALADARAARSLTVAEVAQQLKLSATQVEALEAEAYDRLPGPVFVRGFVRNYARLLDLDADVLAEAVDLPHSSAPASAAIPLSRNIPFPEQRPANWRPYALGLAVIIIAVALFEIFFSAPPTMVVSTVSPGSESVPVSMPAETANPTPVEAPAALPPVTAETAVSEAPLAAPVAAQVSTPAGISELHFVFNVSSWVEVRDRNDRVLFSQLNPAGSEQRVQGRPPLNVVVGNARGVRLTYQGQPFDLAPHTRVEVARFTLE